MSQVDKAAPADEREAIHQIAFERGGTDGGKYLLDADDLDTVIDDAYQAGLSHARAQSADKGEPVGEAQLKTGGGISLLHVNLIQPLPPGTKLYTTRQPAHAVEALVEALAYFASRQTAIQAKFDLHGPEDIASGMRIKFKQARATLSAYREGGE